MKKFPSIQLVDQRAVECNPLLVDLLVNGGTQPLRYLWQVVDGLLVTNHVLDLTAQAFLPRKIVVNINGNNRLDIGDASLVQRLLVWMWLKNRVNWSEREAQKRESMALVRCVTGMAYEMRLVLQGIYEWKDAEVARKLFGNWCPWVQAMRAKTGELLKPMARAARMIESNLEGILTHWARGLTTAFMEGLNSLFSAVKRKACGDRTVEYMTTMLYFVAGKLTLPCYRPTESSKEPFHRSFVGVSFWAGDPVVSNERHARWFGTHLVEIFNRL